MHKANELLSENEDKGSSDSACSAELQRCGVEVGALLLINVTDNPDAVHSIHLLNMQDGTILAEPPSEESMSKLLVSLSVLSGS